jgi:isohexenylglutaconyl-CoA hydratase
MNPYRYLVIEDAAGVRRLTLNRPEARNAMSPEMVAELEAALRDTAARADLRALVMRGAGGHFCAGADLKNLMAGGLKPPQPGEVDPIVAVNRAFGTLLRAAEALPQVLITVLEGAVLGGGFGLACVSDVAFAHTQAKFGLPETTRGLPPAQIAPFVVTRIGLTRARRLALTGAQFRGREALALGLVHEVFEDEAGLQALLDQELAAIRQCAPRANALTKAIVLGVGKQDMDAVLDDAAHKFAACVRGPEAPEGIAAFLQKRAPKWAQSE